MFHRQSIPPQVPNQLKFQDSLFNKMQGSTKKSNNKISIYSKRSTNANSPQKKDPKNSINMSNKNQYKFLQTSGNYQGSSKFQTTQPSNIQLRKINTFNQQKSVPIQKKYSHQTQNNPFYSRSSKNERQKQQQPLSQLRPKQAESQINQSSFDVSFVIGGSSQLNLHANSKSVKTDVMISNMLKFMQQQIIIAKNAYSEKTNQSLRANARLIQQVNNRLAKNQELLKRKDRQLAELRNKLSKDIDSPKKSSSSSKNNIVGNQLPPSAPRNKKQQESFLHKKIADLQKQVTVIAQRSQGLFSVPNLNDKIVLIESGLIKYFSSKLACLDQKMSIFMRNKQQKTSNLQQKLKQIENSIMKQPNKQVQKINTKLKQIILQMNQINSEYKIFITKEFKYQNFKVIQFQRQLKQLKAQVREIQTIQFQNQKMAKIYQTGSRINVENMEIVQTKFINQNQKTVYRNVFANNHAQYIRQNPNRTEDSIISMNFSQTQQSLYSCQNINMENAFSKLVKITDMKQTNAPTQNSPFLNKQYFMPIKAPFLQKHQVQSRIQPFEKSSNLKTQLKIQTPKKTPLNTLIYHKDHSNSFWSISQLEDVIDPIPNNQEVNDFDDDEFYYPLEQSKSRLFASRLSKNSSQFNSPNSKIHANLPAENGQNHIFGLGSKKQSHLYHLNDDYQNFSQQEEDDQKYTVEQNNNNIKQRLTRNQQNLMLLIKTQKCETPLKVKFDKRGFLIIKSVNDRNQRVNGKEVKMQLYQAERLSQMGVVTLLSLY